MGSGRGRNDDRVNGIVGEQFAEVRGGPNAGPMGRDRRQIFGIEIAQPANFRIFRRLDRGRDVRASVTGPDQPYPMHDDGLRIRSAGE